MEKKYDFHYDKVIDKEKIDNVFKNYDRFDISKYAEELAKENQKAQNRMIIDDIMVISSGKYKTYDEYVNAKQQIIEDAEEMNKCKKMIEKINEELGKIELNEDE